ncbi:MAG: hypothetical protein FJ098_08180, partial [Deltaproteobacteria bacterium]|nr:hypothetical protein [Deltaproteobacteria bacterium]
APERFLALGLGTGNALRGSLQLGLDTTIAELVPGVVKALPLTQPDAEDLAADPRLHLEMNDGRNFLLLTDRRFDVIVVDASPPLFSSGTVNLYSLEFVRLAAERLREDGILAIWVPLPCFESDFWQIARNFTEVFPRVMVWQHPDSDVGVHIFGSAGEGVLFDAPAERLGERIRRMGLGERDTRYLEQWVPGGRLMSDAEVRQGSAGYPPVTDDQPGTEFPLFRFLRGETYHRTNAFLQGARRPAAVP